MFQTLVITHAGMRGRPSHPRTHEFRAEAILNGRGSELGAIELEAQKDGSVLLTGIMADGSKRTMTFKAQKAARKARKAKKAA